MKARLLAISAILAIAALLTGAITAPVSAAKPPELVINVDSAGIDPDRGCFVNFMVGPPVGGTFGGVSIHTWHRNNGDNVWTDDGIRFDFFGVSGIPSVDGTCSTQVKVVVNDDPNGELRKDGKPYLKSWSATP